jgi:Ca2+-binding RTX toxin-like protein
MSSNHKHKFQYSVLEDRRLLAVSATLSSGTLSIFGDALANTVNVDASGSSLFLSGDLNEEFVLSQVSAIEFFGSGGDDVFDNSTDIDTLAVGHDGDDELRTAGGTDRLFGGNGNDLLVSTGGNDRLIGNDGIDILFGGGGNDAIFGLGGNDELHGEGGDDNLVAGFGDDVVFGGEGDDTVFGHFGADEIYGGEGNDRLFGQDDNDTIYGEAGDDTVRGGLGNDILQGNDGDDRALGDEGDDDIVVGEGNDIVYGGEGNDDIRGGEGNDLLFSNEGDDVVYGDAGNDVIRGNDGNDRLFGGNNADRVDGDAGDDYVEGGTASDVVLGDIGNDTIVGDSSDRALGGAGDDLIQLGVGGNDRVTFAGDYSKFVVTSDGDQLIVRDTTGDEGLDRVSGAESFIFSDGVREAAAEVTKRVYVQPIIVSDDNGSNTAVYFGDDEQSFDIRREIDEIYLQAGIDVEFLDERTINSTFFNFGTGNGVRLQEDLNSIVRQGDTAGVGHVDGQIIDLYFVNRVPGFEEVSANTANGLAFLDANGITMHAGENLLSFANGRDVIARVAAHEIGHNLGLNHVSDSNNLMASGDELNANQVSIVLDSDFSQTDGEAFGTLVELTESGEDSSGTGGCGCGGGCAACTGAMG